MSEENVVLRARQNCCRLCLAPDSECISILNSYAADKEPLATKIHNCVSIKITSSDRLSLRVCHACISYLNSWQSFKNRCSASQQKQRAWLEAGKRQQQLLDNNNVSISTMGGATGAVAPQQQRDGAGGGLMTHPDGSGGEASATGGDLATSILDGISSLKKRKSLTVYPLPAVQIKDEPVDVDEEYGKQHDESDELMMDPTLFLERTEEEGDEALMHGSGYEFGNGLPAEDMAAVVAAAATVSVEKGASCRACKLKFSTRANARRHERKLHPNLFELSSATPNKTPVTQPTAALAAALELQRVAAVTGGSVSGAMAIAAGRASLGGGGSAGGGGASGGAGHAAAFPGRNESAVGADGSMSSQKYRQEVVNAFSKYVTGTFDYDQPEKYQNLLTDEKILFLQQNEEFLSQYQTMTCRCCQKFYSTYKNFMAHMRKKYATLPRNLCFNCLKLNDSKALFISHLKQRNCINMYKVLHALMAKDINFANAVTASLAAAPEKVRAKELLVNKMYECRLCPKQCRLKLDFRAHVYEQHANAQQKDVKATQCVYCAMDFADPVERKRHHNNMDCLVRIRCLACSAKFDSHQRFLDHAYEKHLSGFGEAAAAGGGARHDGGGLHGDGISAENSPGKKSSICGDNSYTSESRSSALGLTASGQKSQYFSRMPQACPICGQQYNNYNNVLRHMESKHPDQLPQTYKCVKCGIGYPRLSNLREHMVSSHAADKTKHSGFEYIVNADAIKMTDGGTPNVYTGRYDYVMKDLLSITNGGTLDDDDDMGEHSAKKMKIDTSIGGGGGGGGGGVGGGSTGGSISGGMQSSLKECPICSAVFNNNIGLSNHMRSHTAAAQSAAAAALTASRKMPNSLTITPMGKTPLGGVNHHQQHQTAQQQAVFKRSLEQAADRRFRRMRCRICQRRFSSKKSYRFHMLNDHQIRNVQFIKCKLCDAEFAYEKGLKVHMFKIHNTLLKEDMIIKQFECEICSIVYRTDDQLAQHKKSVHGTAGAAAAQSRAGGGGSGVGGVELDETNSGGGADMSGISTPLSSVGLAADRSGLLDSSAGLAQTGPLYWYQCKYCPSNFNTNKKLAIHINSHDEFDSKDYSCKDCGNVYSGRKSLWVHRYKKHPQVAEPSECVLCKKMFFDGQMLENHIPTCNRKPITATGAMADMGGAAAASAGGTMYKHKTGDDDDDETAHNGATDRLGPGRDAAGGGGRNGGADDGSAMKIQLPEVACTICGQRFTDQDLFAKHIQVHEMELYTDNPLAAMFDTGPADPNQFYLDRVNDNGEYACDLCPKTFTQMTAFKVHRKWHFRGDNKQQQQNQADHQPSEPSTGNASAALPTPISRPPPAGLRAVGLMPTPPALAGILARAPKRRRALNCDYCTSTFISNNNLRRHIYELHKDAIGTLPRPPKIELDEPQSCRRCGVRFATKTEWIEHKVADARIMKPFGPFQWGCDLCGAYVSRKEKLLSHIHNHLKESFIVPADQLPARHADDDTPPKKSLKNGGGGGGGGGIRRGGIEGRPAVKMTVKQEDGSLRDAKEEFEEDGMEEEEEEEEADEDEAEMDAEEDDVDGEMEDVADEVEAEADGEGDGDGDGEEYEELDEEFEDDLQHLMGVNDDANDCDNLNDEEGNMFVYEDADDDEDGEGEEDEEEEEDVEDTNDDDTNDSKPRRVPHITIKPVRNSAETTTEAEDSRSYGVAEEEEDDEEEDDDDDDDDDDADAATRVGNAAAQEDGDGDDDDEADEDDDEEEEGDDDEAEASSSSSSEEADDDAGQVAVTPAKARFSCDLCQVFFDTQQELQKHVKLHFLNGPGSVSLTEIKSKPLNKSSRSSSSDVVAVASS